MSAATLNWAGAMVLAALLALGTTLDGPEDHSADWELARELDARHAAQAEEARKAAAAQALCTEKRGPNSEARWTPAGQLVCTTRRGMRSAAP